MQVTKDTITAEKVLKTHHSKRITWLQFVTSLLVLRDSEFQESNMNPWFKRSLSASLVLFASLPATANQQDVIAQSIPLPTLAISATKQLSMSLVGVECGSSEYFVDNERVSILANGTPLEFSRTCHGGTLQFKPISRSENDLFAEILLTNRNLSLRYMASARSYTYNDWQLEPIKQALK